MRIRGLQRSFVPPAINKNKVRTKPRTAKGPGRDAARILSARALGTKRDIAAEEAKAKADKDLAAAEGDLAKAQAEEAAAKTAAEGKHAS
jgi:hypothetical protein